MVSTNFGDETHVMRSIEAGAAGYLLKDSSPARMGDEIRSLASGGSPISPIIARQVLHLRKQYDAPLPLVAGLTDARGRRVRAWARLVALAATDPGRRWRAVTSAFAFWAGRPPSAPVVPTTGVTGTPVA